jgi:hypothetical protein
VIAFVQTVLTLNTVRNGFGRTGTDLGDAQAMGIAKVSNNSGLINLGRTIPSGPHLKYEISTPIRSPFR